MLVPRDGRIQYGHLHAGALEDPIGNQRFGAYNRVWFKSILESWKVCIGRLESAQET